MSRASRIEVRILIGATALSLALAGLMGATHHIAGAGSAAPTQITEPTTAPTTTPTTAPPTTPTTSPPTTAPPTTPPTTAPPRPTTTFHRTTTTGAATSSTAATSTTLATTSTSFAVPSSSVTTPAVANPVPTTAKPKSSGGSGGLSDTTKLWLVVSGLLAVGAGILALTFLYWRRTRPGPVAPPSMSPAALDALAGLEADGPPTLPVPVVGAAAAAAAVTDTASSPVSGLNALVPPGAPPVPGAAPMVGPLPVPGPTPSGASPSLVPGIGGVTPDPRAGVRILGPTVGATAAAVAAKGAGEASDDSPADGGAGPTDHGGDPVSAPDPGPGSEPSVDIARELWPGTADPTPPEPAGGSGTGGPTVASPPADLWLTDPAPGAAGPTDEGDGLADLSRVPLNIVTLEDLQERAREARTDSDASNAGAGPTGGDRG